MVSKYELVVERAVGILLKSENRLGPREAYEKAAQVEIPNSESSRKKGCPKSAFLGLCEDGFVTGVQPGNYKAGKKNKSYAVAAARLALSGRGHQEPDWDSIWSRVKPRPDFRHNHQMNVVGALWRLGFLKQP